MSNPIKQSLEGIKTPAGASERIQKKIEAELGRPMREMRVILKPRRSILRPVLAAAAVIALCFLGILGLRQLRNADPAGSSPAARTQPIRISRKTGSDLLWNSSARSAARLKSAAV